MQIKRFEAENMTEALRLVKQEFGSEAVILSARSLEKKGGVFWPVKRLGVEVTAANDTYYPETKKTSSSKIRKFENLDNKKSLIGSLYGGIMALKNKPDNIFQNHAKELADLNQRMLSQYVEENIARKLTEEVNRIASPKEPLKDNELKLYLIRVFKEMGITAGPLRIEPGKQKVVAFIGPTGVGKTTTIAKLAAIHAIKMKKQVALITLDNYRIGGIDQLKIYAKIIGIPIEVASTGKEFKECLNRLKDKDLILIDTAGMSQRNEYQFNELRIFFNKVRRVETHLLLSATTKEDDLIDILARFKVFRINKLLFTKLDESTSYGNMLNQLIRSKIPVSYFTNGQQIPEDIEIATLEKLVDLITDQEKDGKHRFISQVVSNHHSSEACVASKNSIFFHRFDCQLAKKIKQENIIVFERAIDAVNKQLKPCSSCCPDMVEKQSLYSWDADKRKSGTYQ
jgi:flagellar biosynthesis protein FlhF